VNRWSSLMRCIDPSLRGIAALRLDAANVSVGSIASKIDYSGDFRLSLKSGSTAEIAVGPVRASCGHDAAGVAIKLH
jgi:hypothetical protein